jgi:hypothetical protein
VKRLIAFGFPLAAICVALLGPDARAEKPMAVCKDGKCVVEEKDWKRFKEFWKSVEKYANDLQEKAQQDARRDAETVGRLAGCMAMLEERKE